VLQFSGCGVTVIRGGLWFDASLVYPCELVPQVGYLWPLLLNLTSSSCNLANPKAVVKSLGLSIVTVILISSFNPLKKVLTLNP
jgi:hypothetical protein